MKKCLEFAFGVVIVLFLTVFTWSPSPTMGAETSNAITLKAMVPWPVHTPANLGFVLFVDKVNEKAKGALKIDIVGGPEAIPARNQFDALKTGVIDVLNTTPSYHRCNEAAAIQAATASSKEIRARGWYDLMAEVYKPHNVLPIGRTGDGIHFSLFMNKKVNSPADFKGLRIRTVPVYQPFVTALGGAPITLSGPEIYGALERGVVDGVGSVMINLRAQGYYEVIKYTIDHEFYNGNHHVYFNSNSWNKLSKNLKDICIQSIIEVENESPAMYGKVVQDVKQKCIKDGMTFIKFSEKDAEAYVKLAYSSAWADLLPKIPPQYRDKIQQILTK